MKSLPTLLSRTPLVCFSHLRWDFVYQRPHHLMSRAAREHEVVFFEEPRYEAMQMPRLDLRRVADHLTVATPVLSPSWDTAHKESVQRDLLEGLWPMLPSRRRILWYQTPFALAFTRDVDADVRVYDNMDELSAFAHASPRLRGLERELLERADVVFCGGRSLYEAKRARHRNVHLFPSSIDAAHFRRAREPLTAPPEYADLPRPRLGFFGVVDERMDLALIDRLAEAEPQWQIVMVGPVAKLDEARLPRRDNLHWLGARPYASLPEHLAQWDVGLMPFALNDATRFISPTKTPEFLAAGVPVVSSAVRDVVRPYGERGLVEIADGLPAWRDTVRRLLARPREPWLAEVDRFIAPMSWDRTWRDMQAALTQARRRAAHAVPAVGSPLTLDVSASHV